MSEENQVALKECRDVLEFVKATTKSINDALADGKLDFSDVFAASPMYTAGREALKDISVCHIELLAASPEDRFQLGGELLEANVQLCDAMWRLCEAVKARV